MAKRTTHRRSRAAEEHRAESTNAGSKPEVPQDLAMIAWLLAPQGIETLRRQLIDGKAGPIEPLLYTLAYSGPLEPDAERRSVRFVTTAQFWAEQAGHAVADPPKADDRKPSNPGGEKIGSASGYRIKWDKVVLDARRRARALVEDPGYQESLRRRLADGKAPKMMALLLRWPEKKSRDPYELRRGKPPLTVATKYLPWDPRGDPMREQGERMIEAKAREEEEARARQAAAAKQAAAAPEEPEEADQLESVYIPEPDDPPEPHYRSR